MKRFWPAFILAMALGFGTVAAEPLSHPGVDAPELAALGPHGVGLRSIVLSDASSAGVRALTVDLWYPAKAAAGSQTVTYADALPGEPPRGMVPFSVEGLAVRDAAAEDGTYPLIIVSHGYSGTPAAMTWLTENLASKGYVVAAIHHRDPDISDASKTGEPVRRRPLDISFVAKALLAQAHSGTLAHVDATRVALIGYSMGGYGVVTVAGAQLDPAARFGATAPDEALKPYMRGGAKVADLAIPGLKAVVAIAPAGGGGAFIAWGPEGLSMLKTPLLVIVGDRDHVVGFAKGPRQVFEQAVHAHSYLLVFENGGHNIGMNAAPAQMRDHLWDLDWFEDPVWSKTRTAAVQQHMITAFLDRYVKGDTSRDAYLTTDTPISNEAVWPATGAKTYGAISPGGPGATWKGFPHYHAVGLELHHRPPTP